MLRVLPCLTLWLLTPIDLLAKSNPLKIRWSCLSIFRILLAVTACLINAIEVILLILDRGYDVSSLIDFWTPVIVACTYLLLIFLMINNKSKGFTRSAACWIFLLSSNIAAGINYYQLLDPQVSHYDTEYITGLAFLPVILVLLIASSFTEQYDVLTITGKPAARDYVSFLSFFTYTWVDRLMYKGYRRLLQLHDLFGVQERCKSRYLSSQFFRNLMKKDESSGHYVLKGVGMALLKTFKWHLLESGIYKLASDGMGFVPPLILKWLLTFVSSKEPTWHGILIILLFSLSSILLNVAQNTFFDSAMTLGSRVQTSLRTNIYRKALSISNSARREKTVGEIVNLMSVDADKFNGLMGMIHLTWAAVVQICVSLYLLYRELGYSAFAGVASIVIIMPFNAWISRKVKKAQAAQMKHKDERVKSMNEILNGIKVVKLYAWEEAFMNIVAKIRNLEMRLLRRIAYFNALFSFSFSVTPTLVTLITFAVYSVASDENVLDPAKLFFSLSIFNILRMPLMNVPMLLVSYINSAVSLKRLNAFFSSPDLSDYVTRDESEHAVSIREAVLSWSDKEESSEFKLNISDFTVEEGSLVAVVGVVGSGKSSLLSGLLNEMILSRGRVNISSNIATTAYVSQQAWIQNLTLQNNVLFGKDLVEERYEQIISMCELLPDLAILPAGDQTEIGEKGINLSGGQKQRLSLARACYSEADLFLLDDPLSAVDSHVGKKLFDNVLSSATGYLKSKTRILVTNSVAILPSMDKIYVMKNGEISESGSYTQLMERKGDFSEFLNEYSKQHSSNGWASAGATDATAEAGNEEKESSGKASSVKKDTLIAEEKREKGGVKWNIFYTYIRLVTLFPVVIVFLILSHVADAGGRFWLSVWSQDKPINQSGRMIVDPVLRNERLLVFGLLGFLETLLMLFSALLMAKAATDAAIKIHERLLRGVLRSPMLFFETTPVGRIVNRFSQDVRSIDVSLQGCFTSVIENILTLVSCIVMIMIAIPIFIVIVIPLLIIFFLVQRYFVATSRQVRRLARTTHSPIYSNFSETLAGIATIRAYASADRFISEASDNFDKNVSCQMANIAVNRWLSFRVQLIGVLAIFFVSLFAVLSRATLDAGLIGLAVTYAMQISLVLSFFIRSSSMLETEIVSVERVLEYAENKPEAEWDSSFDKKPEDSWPQHGEIEIKDFSTRYRPELELAVQDMNLHIRAKEKIGVVGRTGAGKSTISLSLFRIMEPASGTLVIDGVNIREIGLHDLRNRLTIIPQDPVLFSGSLRTNLDPFEKESDEVLWQCLEYAHMKEYVTSLDNGLDYKVQEGGQNLSVGQRQLLCLARALLRKTKVLVLDEATAAVDLETDSLIQSTIREQFADCTVITIAHRLNTILDSDRVLVMHEGRVAEFDSPNKLMQDQQSIFHGLAVDAGLL